MRIALMQPYFVPYLGYFSLIKQTDHFILCDAVQYIHQGWIARNRILRPVEGWQYIVIPIKKHSRRNAIKDVEISADPEWKEKIFRQLTHYKKHAPYYEETIALLEKGFDIETNSIVKLNENILRVICDYIGLDVKMSVFSEMDLDFEQPAAPDEWPLNVCKALGNVDEYWNPEGGVAFYDRTKYKAAGVDIKFLKINFENYSQGRSEFEPGMSIVDVMMFNEPESINKMLDDYILL